MRWDTLPDRAEDRATRDAFTKAKVANLATALERERIPRLDLLYLPDFL